MVEETPVDRIRQSRDAISKFATALTESGLHGPRNYVEGLFVTDDPAANQMQVTVVYELGKPMRPVEHDEMIKHAKTLSHELVGKVAVRIGFAPLDTFEKHTSRRTADAPVLYRVLADEATAKAAPNSKPFSG